MAPKGKGAPPPPSAAEAVESVVRQLRREDLVVVDLIQPLDALCTTAATVEGVAEIAKAAESILLPVASCLTSQVASLPVDELTEAHVASVEAAARLVHTCIHTAPKHGGIFCSVEALAPYLSLLHPGPGEDAEWREAGEPSMRAEAARHACVALAAIASLPEGCARMRQRALPPLLLITGSPNLLSPALQSQAAFAIASCVGSTLGRIQLRSENIDHLLELVAPPATDESLDTIRLRSHCLLILGQCMYDAVLRNTCVNFGLMERAVALLGMRAPVEQSSNTLAVAMAELRANTASLVAISGQSEQGRQELLASGASAPLLRILALDPDAAEGTPAPPPSVPLVANVALAVAHLALLPAAAESLGAAAVGALIALLSPSPPERLAGQPSGWDALRGNVCVALGSLLSVGEALDRLLADDHAGVQAIASIIVEEGAPSSLRAAASDVLGRVARTAEGREAVLSVAGDAVAQLFTRLQAQPFGDSEELEASLYAIAVLAAHDSVRAMLRGKSAILSNAEDTAASTNAMTLEEGAECEPPPPTANLVRLLGGEAPSLRRATAIAIAASCHGGDIESAKQLVHWGAVNALSALVHEKDSGVSAAAASALRAVCLAIPSAMLWLTLQLPIGVQLGEDFCAVPTNSTFGDLEALKAMPDSDEGADILFVSSEDESLAALVAQAKSHVDSASSSNTAVSSLARMVSDALGGSVEYDKYEHFDASDESMALRQRMRSRVVPIGKLRKGGARARAVLFKALADRCGLACGLTLGRCVSGAHAHHAWATVPAGHEVAVVDLLHNPGELLPAESEAALRYQRVREFAFSSLASSRTEPFVLQKLHQS